MKVMIAALIAALLTTSGAFAQSMRGIPSGDGPGHVPFGAGTQRGMQDVNNSGQNGFITLFPRGAHTAVVVALDGTHRSAQRAAIVRGSSCDTIGTTVGAMLTPLNDGLSRGYVPMTMARLLSGNYVAVVYSNAGPRARPVACGELYS